MQRYEVMMYHEELDEEMDYDVVKEEEICNCPSLDKAEAILKGLREATAYGAAEGIHKDGSRVRLAIIY